MVYEVRDIEATWFGKNENHQTSNYPDQFTQQIGYNTHLQYFEIMKPPLTFKDVFFHATTR